MAAVDALEGPKCKNSYVNEDGESHECVETTPKYTSDVVAEWPLCRLHKRAIVVNIDSAHAACEHAADMLETTAKCGASIDTPDVKGLLKVDSRRQRAGDDIREDDGEVLEINNKKPRANADKLLLFKQAVEARAVAGRRPTYREAMEARAAAGKDPQSRLAALRSCRASC